MVSVAQAIRNKEGLNPQYSEKAAIGALYDEFFKGIDRLKKGDVYTIDEAREEIDKRKSIGKPIAFRLYFVKKL